MGKRKDNSTSELDELKRRLEEAEETLRAIRDGESSAVIDDPTGRSDLNARRRRLSLPVMIDEMNEGAVSDSARLVHSLQQSQLWKHPGLDWAGVKSEWWFPFGDYIVPEMREQFLEDLEKAREQSIRREYTLSPGNGKSVRC
jgi:hypothetical protein